MCLSTVRGVREYVGWLFTTQTLHLHSRIDLNTFIKLDLLLIPSIADSIVLVSSICIVAGSCGRPAN